MNAVYGRTAAIASVLILGILSQEYMHPTILASISGIVIAVIWLRYGKEAIYTALLLAGMMLTGAARYGATQTVAADDISRFSGKAIGFDGYVVSDPEPREGKVMMRCAARYVYSWRGRFPCTGTMVVSLLCDSASAVSRIQYGDEILARAVIYAPPDATNPSQFSYARYLKRNGIFTCAYIEDISALRVISDGHGNLLYRAAYSIRRFLKDGISAIHSPKAASVISGMALGSYSQLTPELYEDFSKTGTIHLLAASGYNCCIIVLVASALLMRLKIDARVRNLIVIVFLAFYLLIVGLKASLVRATLMAVLVLIALPLGRVSQYKNILFSSMCVVLLIRPADLFDVGFQLSYMGVAALVWIVPTLEKLRRKENERKLSFVARAKSSTISAALATVAVSLLTCPIVSYHFNYISTVSIFSNMALALAVPVIFVDGFISPLVAHVPVVGQVVGYLGNVVTTASLGVIHTLGSFSASTVSVPSPSIILIVAYYAVLFTVMWYLRSKLAKN